MLFAPALVAGLICFGSLVVQSSAQGEPRSWTKTSGPAHLTLSPFPASQALADRNACALEAPKTTTAGQQPQPTVDVVVGAAGKPVFDPPAVNTWKGTLLRFSFLRGNYTLIQSSFDDPCKGAGVFDTGFNQFNPTNTSGAFVVDFVVGTADPQWFFCTQTLEPLQCNAGMVFSLNAGDKADAFVEEARPATRSFLDGSNLRTGSYCPSTTSGLNTTRAPYLNATQALIPSFVLSGYLASLSSGGRIGPNSTSITPAISNEATSISPSRLLHAGFVIGFVMFYV